MIYTPKRLRYFNKVMQSYEKFSADATNGIDEPKGTECPEDEYNLVSSLCDDGMHHPCFDIDGGLRVVPSTTEGHYHLYFDDVALSWEQYSNLLGTLRDCGMIDPKWADHAISKGYSTLRPEHVKKLFVFSGDGTAVSL